MQALLRDYVYANTEQILEICDQPSREPWGVYAPYFDKEINVADCLVFTTHYRAKDTDARHAMPGCNYKDIFPPGPEQFSCVHAPILS